MIYLVAFVILVLATARLTRLVTRDDLTRPVRLWIDRRFGENSPVSRLVWCHWCSAVWVSFGTSLWAAQILYSCGVVPRDVAIMLWIMFIPASSYAASRIIDMEKDD